VCRVAREGLEQGQISRIETDQSGDVGALHLVHVHCGDNAVSESVWGSLKVARLHGRRFAERLEALDKVTDWMSFDSHRRLHSTLGYVSVDDEELNESTGNQA